MHFISYVHHLQTRRRAAGNARAVGTSAYRGVSWHTQTSRWKAQIKVSGKDVNLGRHRDEAEAARAYDRAAICARGANDAKLNFALADYEGEAAALAGMALADLAASLRGVEQRLQARSACFASPCLTLRAAASCAGSQPPLLVMIYCGWRPQA